MIKEEIVRVKITMFNRDYYRSQGFNLHGGKGQYIEVLTSKLKPDSSIKVTRICDRCGEGRILPLVKTSCYCGKCAVIVNNESRAKPEKTTCPECKGKKSYSANLCRKCRDTSGENNPMYGKKNPSLTERNKNRKPEDHWNWKGGVDAHRSAKLLHWSKEVKSLSGFKCDSCGYGNPLALDAHHLESYDNNPELADDLSNGVCLCKNCHTVFHKMYGFGNNTKEQYLEYKELQNGRY